MQLKRNIMNNIQGNIVKEDIQLLHNIFKIIFKKLFSPNTVTSQSSMKTLVVCYSTGYVISLRRSV